MTAPVKALALTLVSDTAADGGSGILTVSSTDASDATLNVQDILCTSINVDIRSLKKFSLEPETSRQIIFDYSSAQAGRSVTFRIVSDKTTGDSSISFTPVGNNGKVSFRGTKENVDLGTKTITAGQFIGPITNVNDGSSKLLWIGTQAELDALEALDEDTVYLVAGQQTPA